MKSFRWIVSGFVPLYAIFAADLTVTIYSDTDYATGGIFDSSTMTGDLRGCLNYLNTIPDTTNTVSFFVNGTITLGNTLPVLNLATASNLTVGNNGHPAAIEGLGTYQGFIAKQGTIAINSITFLNCIANGGAGGNPGGGGGMGAGGGLFVDDATVFLERVAFINCTAAGGNGGSAPVANIDGSGGGGGMGGSGGDGGTGSGSGYGGGGGGGGLAFGGSGGVGGNGGTAGSLSGGGGGGGGIQSQGGSGSADATASVGGSGGGGGGLYTAAGGSGQPSGNGTDGTSFSLFSGPTIYSGGGGGGTSESSSHGGQGGGSTCSTGTQGQGGSGGLQTSSCPASGTFAGGAGSANGGGGGGGNSSLVGDNDLTGGAGGLGSGGGGGGSRDNAFVQGGAGGWGGGSGGSGGAPISTPSITLESGGTGGGGGGGAAIVGGANGGFGGGGGGGSSSGSALGGVSAFGGGSGGAFNDVGDNSTNSGIGGGFGNKSGGGGAALGAAIFVNTGEVIIGSGCSFSGGTLTSGTGANSGATAGSAICAVSGTVTFATFPGGVVMNGDTVADGSLYSINGAGFTQGDPAHETAVALISTNSAGIDINWDGVNTYSGPTTISTARVTISSDQAFGLSSAILNAGGGSGFDGSIILNGNVSMSRPVNVLLGHSFSTFHFDTNGHNLQTSGPFSNVGPFLAKDGAGTWTFTNSSSTYSGTLIITAGTFALGGSGNVSTFRQINLRGGTFDISGIAGTSTTINQLAATSGTVTLGAKDLIFIETANTSFAGSIDGSGGGSLEKQGAATFNLTGSGNIVGGTTITAGNFQIGSSGSLTSFTSVNSGAFLQLDGALTGNIIVNSGGTLFGTGQELGGIVNVTNGGTIQPGDTTNGTGILTVNILQLNASSKFLASLNHLSSPMSSMVEVTNGSSISLDGTLTVLVNDAPYDPGDSFTILTAPGGFAATQFSNVVFINGQLLGPNVLVSYLPTSVVITITAPPPPQINLDFLEGNENGEHIAEYLNGLATDHILKPYVFAFSRMSPSQLNAAMDSISPARNAIGAFVSQNAMFTIADVVSCRMSQQRFALRNSQMNLAKESSSFEKVSAKSAYGVLSASSAPQKGPWMGLSLASDGWGSTDDEETSYSELDELKTSSPRGSSQIYVKEKAGGAFWIQGLAEFMAQNEERHRNPAYSAVTGGGIVGGDYYGPEDGLLGAALCYAQSTIEQAGNAGQNWINYYAATVYGTLYLDDVYLELGLAGALNRFQNKRFMDLIAFNGQVFRETARSVYWGGQVVPHIALGYDANFCWGTLEPFLAVDCAMLFQSSFSEKGAYPLNMHQNSNWSQLLRGELGLHAYEIWSFSFGDFVLRETLSFVNQQPFNVGTIHGSLVGYPPGFIVESFTHNQSLLSPGIQFFYRSRHGGFSSISYKGEFQVGSGWYRSNTILAKLGMYF